MSAQGDTALKKIILSTLLLAVLAAVPATAVEFDIGADVVSRYVWRGTDFGDSPAIQPSMSASFIDGQLEIGYWGSFAINSNTAGNPNELDMYATFSADPVSITITDYFFPAYVLGSDEWSNQDNHMYELSIAATLGKIDLLAGFMTGEKIEDSIWAEGNYNFGDVNGVDVSFGIGIGTENYAPAIEGRDEVAGVISLNMTKGDYSASYIYNHQQDVNFLVIGKSF